MNRFVLPILAALLLGACTVSFNSNNENPLPPPVAGTEAQQAEAFAAAKDIIHAIDRGEYSSVWGNSGELLKNSANEFVFTKMLEVTRGNLGKPEPRGRPRIGFTSKVDQNAPVGEYCVLEVDTDFDGTIVTEKLVLERVSGKWKLAGYFMSSKTKISASE
jgi:hypothetical protein